MSTRSSDDTMYELYVNQTSPYSMKASAVIGYCGLDCELRTQNIVNRYATIKRLTGKTMVPMLRDGEWAKNDSTHIARFVSRETGCNLLPDRPELGELCWILEDFADEWLSKIVFFSRWHHRDDQRKNAIDVGDELTAGIPGIRRVVGHVSAAAVKKYSEQAGIRAENREALERSRDRLLQALESVLDDSPRYLFCVRPTIADFAFYGQLGQYERDPTGRKKLRMYPNVTRFVRHIDAMTLPHPIVRTDTAPPRPVGEMRKIFAEFLGTYWRVLVTNHRAVADGRRREWTEAEMLDGRTYRFKASGYLVGRLEFILEKLNSAYANRSELFGADGLEIEHALIAQIARLSDHEAGRDLLSNFPDIAAK